ncbi:hypothetical protein GCM10027059_26510 [Myceligenerans halotolerans]
MIVAELESIFTGDVRGFTQAADLVETRGKKLDARRVALDIGANVQDALAASSRVEAEADRIGGLDPEIQVDADTSAAESALDGLADGAERSGSEGGSRGGDALVGGIVGALATIPIAGAIVGIAHTAADAVIQGFKDGLGVEVREDLFSARTGLDEATAGKFGAAAGEAYASNWGDSVAANMDTARQAVQAGLLDPDATQRDAQQIIESLSGVAHVIGEDIPRVTRSAQQLLRTGLARDASEAFDIIVRGQQAGLNVSEDWLDVLDEYSTQWRVLGLEGEQVLGLLSQGVQAGARDTDIAADALKEFAVRAVDDSQTTADGFATIGLSASEMEEAVGKGGETASEALGRTLDALRDVEDPIERNAAAVALFGTQAEDLGAALFAMDLDTAASDFDNLSGAAARALDTIGDNASGKLESAVRNIEVAGNSIKGALAEAFSPQIEGFADFVSQNREAVTTFLFDAAEGALDFGRALAEGAAAGTEGFGDMVATVGPGILGLIGSLIEGIDSIPFVDLEDAVEKFDEIREGAEASFAELDAGSEAAADAIRANLIQNGLDPAQEKLDELRIPAEAAARLSDTSKRLAGAIGEVGYEADGSKSSLDILDGQIDTTTRSGRRLDDQIRGVSDSLHDQVRAAADAGESQASLRDRASQARKAFLDQAEALGVTRRDAKRLADQYGLIPKEIVTEIVADTSRARSAVQSFITDASGRTVGIRVDRHLEARAHGGPVWPGEDFLVGEEGPELVRFSQVGTVVPAAQTAQALSSAPAYQSSGSSMGDIHITHYGGTDAAIERGLTRAYQKRELLRAGGSA